MNDPNINLTDLEWEVITNTLRGSNYEAKRQLFFNHPEIINRRYAERTVLIQAIDEGDLKIVQKLLELGANPNLKSDLDMDSPLRFAARIPSAEIVRVLLEHGANPHDVNRSGYTPVMEAARALGPKARGVVEIMLNHLREPLDLNTAVNLLDHSRVREILETETEPLRHAKCPNDLVSDAVNRKNYEMVDLLIQNGAPINVLPRSGKPSLHRAAESDVDESILRLLLDAGADVEIPDHAGESLFDLIKDDSEWIPIERLSLIAKYRRPLAP
jgi:hypothetical protein